MPKKDGAQKATLSRPLQRHFWALWRKENITASPSTVDSGKQRKKATKYFQLFLGLALGVESDNDACDPHYTF